MPGDKVPAAVHGLKISTRVAAWGATVAGADAVAGGALVAAAADAGAAVVGAPVVGAALVAAGTVAGAAVVGAMVAGVAMVVEPVLADGVPAVVHPDARSATASATTPTASPRISAFAAIPARLSVVRSVARYRRRSPATGWGSYFGVA